MGLSRLDNFLKSVRGTILYVDPGSLDATDSIENQGNSLTRPFKTLQRALVEASRFSYQRGLNNDRFGKTTILLYPGEHVIDNRPGWIPDGSNNYRLRSGETSNDFPPFDLTTNFDVESSSNQLYKLNSVHGGVIVPRGTSIVGMDLRKTIIRPKYVPNPSNDSIERSCIFRITGACYFWQFTVLDANPNGQCYQDYTSNVFVPNFSHHKLSCFEYADGVNDVAINDGFLNYSTDRTDLEMYYEKVGLAYGQSSGRAIEPDYPSSGLDIQPKIDEYRIVGPTGGNVGITSIRAGDGVTATTTVTVTTEVPVPGLDVDTAFQVEGVSAEYDGKFVVYRRIDDSNIQYQVQNAPIQPLPSVAGATLALTSDTVSSASPYIFNCSLRSVYGMCGVLADGDKASGFKSMVIAQFTGIGLQKDDNAFVKYDQTSDTYVGGSVNLFADSRAIYKPTYQNFHIKTVNDAYIQNVSIFAIGYAQHFVSENGGDQSINNSNSNFGAKSLVASGFRRNAFSQDDVGYITHIIPPQEIEGQENSIGFLSIDVNQTIGIASTGSLYLYNETNAKNPPDSVIQGFRIGAKPNDDLNFIVSQSGVANQYSAKIVMPSANGTTDQISAVKTSYVGRTNAGINSITSNTILTLTKPHDFLNGESIRVISSDANLPSGLIPNTVYYAITSGISSDQIKIAKTLNDALSDNPISLYGSGGILKVESRVSDKVSGDIGHPIQFDTANNQWFIKVSTASTENTIYSNVVGFGTAVLGASTPRTYINRVSDFRNVLDKVYKIRYVIPAGSGIPLARPPLDGFVIQESNTTVGVTTSEVAALYSSAPVTLSNVNQLRNPRFIANATWDGTYAYYTSEIPHNLSVGSQIEILNVKTDTNSTGVGNSGFNGTFEVVGVSSAKTFYVGLSTNPGTFDLAQTANRNTSLPRFKRKKYSETLSVYRSQEIERYIPNQQDGIYHLLVINSSNSPSTTPFENQRFSQPIQNFYPQLNRDDPKSDPKASTSYALSDPIGQVVIDEPQHSVTKETVNKGLIEIGVGIGLTNIISNSTGTAHTFYTRYDHGFAGITSVSLVSAASSGAGYGYGTATDLYNAQLVGFAGSTTGSHATARISVNAAGNITSIKIIDGGSAYGIGNTLSVVGVGTTTGFVSAVVKVDAIKNSVGESVNLSGIYPENLDSYNNVYRITAVNGPKQVTVASASTVSAASTTGIGITATSNSNLIVAGRSVDINTLTYNNVSGIATIVTIQNHGLAVNNKITIGGADNSLYNGDFIVNKVNSLTSFETFVGVGTTSPATTGTKTIYLRTITSQAGTISANNENISGRMIAEYAGITTTLLSAVNSATIDEVQLSNTSSLDLNIGDCLLIDDEIVRIKTTVTSNIVKVFRGTFGTRAATHVTGSVVRRINLTPIELRRNSIIRASGHTFEYLGYGPGNYSTALPSRQDRLLSDQEQLLSLSTKMDGGINVYTGMDDGGSFYVGNRKVNSATGQEKVFDTPVPTVTGEDPLSGVTVGFDAITPLEVSVSRSIKVEGGTTGNLISQFNGPVIFNKKVSVTSEDGFETSYLFIKGNAVAARQYTVGISTPILSGNPGDIVYNSDPSKGGYLGHVYTTDNEWYRVGNISLSKSSNIQIFDQIGIGVTTPLNSLLRVGLGTSAFIVDSNGVGIGTTANGFKLQVNGNTNVIGTCYANYFVGDGSGLTNISVPASGWTQITGGIYNTFLNNVGIGTSVARFNLELGSVGSSTTSLYVNGSSVFVGVVTTGNLIVGGALTSSSYNLRGGTGQINAGVTTTTSLNVGNLIYANSTSVGIGTSTTRATLDLESRVRLKTYFEAVRSLSISSNEVSVDLSQAQNFTLTVTSQVNRFRLLNIPSESSSFTIRITQGSTPFTVDLDNLVLVDSTPIPVYWPGGGIVPVVTPVANRTDIYSFKTFDGGSTFYGVVGGQNFTN